MYNVFKYDEILIHHYSGDGKATLMIMKDDKWNDGRDDWYIRQRKPLMLMWFTRLWSLTWKSIEGIWEERCNV